MTDRVSGFTVVLDHDIRDDDIEPVLNAIRMVKGVIAVEAIVADSFAEHVATARRDRMWETGLYRLIANGPPDAA